MKADGRSVDQKVSAHRSKHSATEQRRRSKINERQVYRAMPPCTFSNLYSLHDLFPVNDYCLPCFWKCLCLVKWE